MLRSLLTLVRGSPALVRACTVGFAPRFVANSLLALLIPGGYGFNRTLRKQMAHRKPLTEAQWKVDGDVTVRQYRSYDAYLEHQASKLDAIISIGGFSNDKIFEWRLCFYDHLGCVRKYLPKDARILCVGARQGTEVEVLRELGFPHITGVDLNPGDGNPLVVKGDFMHLKHESGSLDMVYSNSIDHAFNLDEFFQEQARVVKPGGIGVFDIVDFGHGDNKASAYESVEWKTSDVPVSIMKKSFPQIISDRSDGRWRTIIARR